MIPVIRDLDHGFQNHTVSSTVKNRLINEPDLSLKSVMSKSFIPVNPGEGKRTIERTIEYHRLSPTEEEIDLLKQKS